MKTFGKHIVFILSFLLPLVSCVDDELYIRDSIPEGESVITASINFRNFTPALETRSAGDAIQSINSLWIVVYEKDDDGEWVLERNGKIKITDEYDLSTGNETIDNPVEGGKTTTGHATFRFHHRNGEYKIYAVANYDMSDIENEDIDTPAKLKNISLTWNEKNISDNAEMFGCFSNDKSDISQTDEASVVIAPGKTLHSWIRRAASKVTVAFDGANLKEGVEIYIMGVSVKNIPNTCLLGEANMAKNPYMLIENGEMLKYYNKPSTPTIGELSAGYEATVKKGGSFTGSDHSVSADALYFYENMQGKGESKLQDADHNGAIDSPNSNDPNDPDWRDKKPYGTYIEVDAIYNSTVPERKGHGPIKYRFMLGKDIYTDYNAERNHHYKLTLRFNNYANDVDWHIDYKEQVLEVTNPKPFNYLGKIFTPTYRPGIKNDNLGHNFSESNTVYVTSYVEDEQGKMANWKIEFDEKMDGNYKESCSWLDTVTAPTDLPYVRQLTFKAKPITKKEVNIDNLLKSKGEQGTKEAPYNLANPGERVSPANATIKNTANCYIVDGPGYYILPLIYGNAIQNTHEVKSSYSYAGFNFKDYKGKDITSAYIKNSNDPDYTPKDAFVIWQDEDNLVSYDVWGNDPNSVQYIDNAYNGAGGILFYVDGKIRQGNAVIGVSTQKRAGGTIPPVMWSWQIWVTSFDYLNAEDKNIEVTGHNPLQKFLMLPVNLGWCSKHGELVNYYPGRKCRVKFSAGNQELIMTVEQKSHIAYTRGNNTYYQWGRKDPFVGADINGNGYNKLRYISVNWDINTDPSPISGTTEANGKRYTTKEAVNEGLLIRYPDKWHDPRRKNNPAYPGPNEYPYISTNEVYQNLWQGQNGYSVGSSKPKTVYDPCPVGYQIPHINAFSGFTTTGDDTNVNWEFYNVLYENIAGYNPVTGNCGIYSDFLYEFYTNTSKMISIIFPETGYRDWDNNGGVFKFHNDTETIGYSWSSEIESSWIDNKTGLNFEFSRKGTGIGYIRPRNRFYPCDGFPVRPCLQSP